MVKILGLPFDDYVDKQVTTRQTKLAKTQKRPEEISVFNSNTAWVRLSSGVKIESPKALELQNKIGIPQTSIEGTSLARNLVLWAGVSSFHTGSNGVILDPIKGGVGYGLNNTYGFLSGPEQGLKPPPGITSITCNYKNNGSLKQATVNIKCYTRSQFEALEAVYLRLGYTMVLEWGNALWFDNTGDFKQTRAYSIPDLLFKNDRNLSPIDITDQILRNRKNTACNYDGMVGKVANYSWTLGNDLSFDIRLDLISVGDIIDSLKMNVGGTNSADLSEKVKVDEGFQNIAAIVVNKQASKLNAFFYELYDTVFRDAIKREGSPENQAEVDRIDEETKAAEDLEPIKKEYVKVLEEFRKYYQLFQQGLEIHNRAPFTDATNTIRAIRPEDQAAWAEIAKQFDVTVPFLLGLYRDSDKEDQIQAAEKYNASLNAIEKYFTDLAIDSENGSTVDLISLYKKSKNKKDDVVSILTRGYVDFGSGFPNQKVPGGEFNDTGIVFRDYTFTLILQDLIEGLDG
jgi:hypothetical protein